MASHVERLLDEPGYRIFQKALKHMIREAEIAILKTAPQPGFTPDQVVADLRFRQGYLRALNELKDMPQDLMKQLNTGSIPWEDITP